MIGKTLDTIVDKDVYEVTLRTCFCWARQGAVCKQYLSRLLARACEVNYEP